MYDIAVLAVVLTVVAGGTAAAWLLARHDRPSSAFVFGGFLGVLTFWTATHLGTLFSETLAGLLLFKQLSYVGVVTTPVVWFAFALTYTDRGEWLSRRRLALLSVVPATTLVAVFTAPSHSLFYTSISVGSVAGQPVLVTDSGPFHVLNVVYSYGLLLAGTALLGAAALSNSRLYRRQSAVLLVCITVPWVVNMSYHLGWRPLPWVDVTPMAFIATGIPLAVVVVRTDLASFLPVAHERVFRSLDDPMIVVSTAGQVIDANATARRLLGEAPIEGRHVTAVLPEGLLDADGLRDDLDGGVECALDTEDGSRQYLVRRQSVDPDREASRGSVLALTDITARKRRERELRALSERARRKNEQLERMADIIAHDMRTPLSTATKLLSLLDADLDDPEPGVEQSLEDLDGVLDRLDAFADHIPRLARESTDVETLEPCALESVAREAWETVDTGEVRLSVAGSRTLEGDRGRLLQVFENLFGNAVAHGTPTIPETTEADGGEPVSVADDEPDPRVSADADDADQQPPTDDDDAARLASPTVTTIRVGVFDGGFYVEDDGPGIPPDRREDVFQYGVSTGGGSGFGLAIVRTIIEAHGWGVGVTDSHLGPEREPAAQPDGRPIPAGARFEVETGD